MTAPTTFNDTTNETLIRIYEWSPIIDQRDSEVMWDLDWMAREFSNTNSATLDSKITNIASTALWYAYGHDPERGRNLHRVALDIAHLVITKQADYGKENILAFGLQGVKIRAYDKVARLKNLLSKDATPANESIYDSWVDIVGYCALAIMLIEGTFDRPLVVEDQAMPQSKALPYLTITTPSTTHSYSWSPTVDGLMDRLDRDVDKLKERVDHLETMFRPAWADLSWPLTKR